MQTTKSNKAEERTQEITITRIDAKTWRVNTGAFMSDGTFQEGCCEMDGTSLKFKGWMNQMPFRINLGEITRRCVLTLQVGKSATF